MHEAVIIDAARTPIGRRNGSLAGEHPVKLMGYLMKELLGRSGVEPSQVEDVIIGCAGQVDEQSSNLARNAWLDAGLPDSVPGTTVDRQCGSSLQALQFAAQGVMAGGYDLVIAGGVESMSRVPIGSSARQDKTPMTQNLFLRYDLPGYGFNQFMGAQMISQEIGITRKQLDQYGYESHRRAGRAREEGRFLREIIPVPVAGEGGEVRLFSEDETIRSDTTPEKLAALQPVIPDYPLITPGNSSQISDGASAVIVASRQAAERLGLKPRARFKGFAVVGTDPVAMLKGPGPATEKVLRRAGLSTEEIGLAEINEAFASVVLRWQQETGIPMDRVNVNGGAVALGHPLGATGTRLAATLLHELERREERYGLIAICEGPGMANAMVIERVEDPVLNGGK